ncbi:MAG: hypothetical protein ACP5OP_08100 [Leptospirillia bacterium]
MDTVIPLLFGVLSIFGFSMITALLYLIMRPSHAGVREELAHASRKHLAP